MTSTTGKSDLKYETDLKPQSFSAVVLGSLAQIGLLAYVWYAQSGANRCISEMTMNDIFECAKKDMWSRQILATVSIVLATWILSVVLGKTHSNDGTSDPSIVDRLWSILPPLFVWHCYYSAKSPRLLAMAGLSTLWSIRLTWNFARKGGFSGGEDYRWEHLRKSFPGVQWEIFNLVFICSFQLLLIMGFTTPAVVASRASASNPWNHLDTIASVVFFILLVGETVADNQMYNFQTEKYRRKRAGEAMGSEYERGFFWGGLYKYSRHPNYFCEVGMWWCFYVFSVSATSVSIPCCWREWINWTIVPVIYLTILFVAPGASIDFAEALSSQKYSGYKKYQASVNRFVPFWPRGPPAASANSASWGHEIATCDKDFVGVWDGEWEPCRLIATHDGVCDVICKDDNKRIDGVPERLIRPKQRGRRRASSNATPKKTKKRASSSTRKNGKTPSKKTPKRARSKTPKGKRRSSRGASARKKP
eukprot:g5041.t1